MARRLLNALGAIILIALLALVLPLTLPKLFGFQLYNIQTESMVPTLPVGSVIYVKSCEAADLQVGEIITFRLGTGTDLVETHRVAEIDTTNQEITTKGDGNAASDQTKVKFENVVGRVVFHLPYLGSASRYIHSAQGIAACIAAFAGVAVIWMVADRLKVKERVQ